MTDLFRFAQLQSYALAGGGAVAGATSITLKSMTDIDGNALSMAGTFGSIGFGTLEPGNGTLEEQISFTGLTNNTNGTVTLTGISTVLFVYPYTQSSGLAKTHAGSTTFVISNTSGFYDKLTSKSDDETITGLWDFPSGANNPTIGNGSYVAPTLDTQIATKKYVDNVAIAGAPDASNTTKGITKLSVAAVVPGNPIAVGDNDTRVPTQTEADALVGTSGTPSSSNKYVTNNDTATSGASKVLRLDGSGKIPALDGSQITNIPKATDIQTFTSTGAGTWTKPTTGTPIKVLVQVWGSGGSGASVAGNSGGGGGGGYSERWFAAAALSATESLNVAAGGAAQSGNVAGNDGNSSTFSSSLKLVTAGGGQGGQENSAGNACAGGLGGGNFGPGDPATPVSGVGVSGSTGGNGLLGGAGGGVTAGNGGQAGGKGYLGGGGGGGGGTGFGSGGTSIVAGAGGAGATSGSATAGTQPGGGGGGSNGGTSGKGGDGQIIVTTFF